MGFVHAICPDALVLLFAPHLPTILQFHRGLFFFRHSMQTGQGVKQEYTQSMGGREDEKS